MGKFIDAGIGFLFWILAARLYTIEDVGVATALISSLGLVIAFSRLGFDITIIRFMPSYDHSRVFNTCLWITTGAAIAVSIIYLAAVDFISPEITFIKNYAGLFILFAIVNAATITTGNALLAFRRADQKFVQNIIMGGRLLFLFPLVLFGSLGIFYSLGLAYFAAAIYALLIIRQHITLSTKIDREFTRNTFHFSFQNYIAGLLQVVPTLAMPILIVNLLTPQDAALYYIAFTIGTLVLIIPDALSTSFFVEGSHGIDLKKGAIQTLAMNYLILVPAILLLIFFGDQLLGLFGKEYGAAFTLLKIFAVSSLFVTIQNLFIPIQNIRLQVRGIVIMNLIRFILLLSLSYIFLMWFGVNGAGYAWAVTYIILGAGIVVNAKRDLWF